LRAFARRQRQLAGPGQTQSIDKFSHRVLLTLRMLFEARAPLEESEEPEE